MPYPACHDIRVFTFRGDRSPRFSAMFLRKLLDERSGAGPGPTSHECLLHAGHTGVSTDGGAAIWAFNPDGAGLKICDLLDRLKRGEAFPGIVRDDRTVFAAAHLQGLSVQTFDVRYPNFSFDRFKAKLDSERERSNYSYGFPNGDGDCNCTTWLERLGLPLLTGRINEFVALTGFIAYPTRRFGKCS